MNEQVYVRVSEDIWTDKWQTDRQNLIKNEYKGKKMKM